MLLRHIAIYVAVGAVTVTGITLAYYSGFEHGRVDMKYKSLADAYEVCRKVAPSE